MGSHSAIWVIKNIVDAGGKIINFYRTDLIYAIWHKDWCEYENTGLKGSAAVWAKDNLEKISMNKNIERF